MIPDNRIEFKLFGDWEEAIRTTQRLSPVIKRASIAAQLRVGKTIAKLVRTNLANQVFAGHWPPLRTHKKDNQDPRMLISSQMYLNSIEAWRKGNQNFIFIGVRRGIYSKLPNGRRNKIDVATIAAIHERSPNLNRRRPLWDPSIEMMGGPKGILEVYTSMFYSELRRRKSNIIANRYLKDNFGTK